MDDLGKNHIFKTIRSYSIVRRLFILFRLIECGPSDCDLSRPALLLRPFMAFEKTSIYAI